MTTQDALYGRTVGDFTLGDRIGEGGYGAVYRCDQRGLGRKAVIKVLHKRADEDEDATERFRREARLASRLDHPYAAHIYTSGIEEDGLAWIAMELVHGVTLSAWLKRHGPMPLEILAPFLECVAEVVDAAHARGIVHRDLKPDNIMVIAGRGGRLTPKLLDLGIAKLLDEPAAEASDSMDMISTPCDVAVGSPFYMSPEQWQGCKAGPASDIYALGVVAFEALTGRAPFRGDHAVQMATLHCTGRIPLVGGTLPRRIDTIFARALAKSPDSRYATASDLAAAFRAEADAQLVAQIRSAARAWDDSGRLDGLLWRGEILAELEHWMLRTSVSRLEPREVAFVEASQAAGIKEADIADRRRRAARRIGLWTAGLLAMLIFGGFQTYARYQTLIARQAAQDAHDLARATAVTAEIEQGRAALLAGDTAGARQHLGAAAQAGDRGSAFMLARSQDPLRSELARLPGNGRMWSAAWSPDGRLLVTTDDQGAQIWDAATYTRLATLPHPDTVYAAVWSAQGPITACGDGSVRVWDADGRLLKELRIQGQPRWYALAVSADRIAAVDTKGTVAAVWSTDGRVLVQLDLDGDGWPSVAFGPDGTLAVSGGGSASLVDAAGRAHMLPVRRVHALAWGHADRLITGSASGDVSIWSASGAPARHLREAGEPVDAVAYSGDLAAVATRSGTEQIFAASGALVSSGNHVHGRILSLEFSPDGKQLATAASSGLVAISSVETGAQVSVFDAPTQAARSVRFAPDGRSVAGATWDGIAWIWSTAHPYLRWSSDGQADPCGLVGGAAPDGRYLGVACTGHPTRVWDTWGDRLLAELPAVEDVYPVISEDGTQAAIARGNAAEVYELPGGRLVHRVEHGAAVTALAFSHAGGLLVGTADGAVTGLREPVGGAVDALVVLPNGRTAVADASGQVTVHGLRVRIAARARMLRASPDGRWLLAVPSYAGRRSPPTLIDLTDGTTVDLAGPQVYAARWTSTGILTAGADGAARIWDTQGRLVRVLRGDRGFLADAAMGADGIVVGVGGSGSLHFWDSNGERIWKLPAQHVQILGVGVSAHGIVTRSAGGTVSRWAISE